MEYLDKVGELTSRLSTLTHRREAEEELLRKELRAKLDAKYSNEELDLFIEKGKLLVERVDHIYQRLRWYPEVAFFAPINGLWHRCIVNRPRSDADWAEVEKTVLDFKKEWGRLTQPTSTRRYGSSAPQICVAVDERHPFNEWKTKYRKLKNGFQRRSHRVHHWQANLTTVVTRSEFFELVQREPQLPTRLLVSPVGSKAWVLPTETFNWSTTYSNPTQHCRREGPSITNRHARFGGDYGNGFQEYVKPEAFVAGYKIEPGLLTVDGTLVDDI